jgi:ParB-like chromosome segregation protein Spo0J
MREFGLTNPVLVSPENEIIVGHGRVLAAELLALEEVPCIELGHPGPTGVTIALWVKLRRRWAAPAPPTVQSWRERRRFR